MREGGGVWLGGFAQANISFAGAGSAMVVGGWEEGSRSMMTFASVSSGVSGEGGGGQFHGGRGGLLRAGLVYHLLGPSLHWFLLLITCPNLHPLVPILARRAGA